MYHISYLEIYVHTKISRWITHTIEGKKTVWEIKWDSKKRGNKQSTKKHIFTLIYNSNGEIVFPYHITMNVSCYEANKDCQTSIANHLHFCQAFIFNKFSTNTFGLRIEEHLIEILIRLQSTTFCPELQNIIKNDSSSNCFLLSDAKFCLLVSQ